MHELRRLETTRIVSTPEALASVAWPSDVVLLPTAPDEIILTPAVSSVDALLAADPHAIVVSDGSFAGVWVEMADALEFLAKSCEWQLPSERPAFAQGAVAGIATKLYFDDDLVLFVVPAAYAEDFEARLGH